MTSRRWTAVCAAVMVATLTAGCGLHVNSADLFVLKRTGSGRPLSLLVNDGGTVRCNGGAARTLPDRLLLDARQLAQDLDADAKSRLRVAPRPGSVYRFSVSLQDGTVTFPDNAGSAHPELGRAELFALQAARGPCGL